MKTVFKVKDKVFDIRFGWGTITDVIDTSYPIIVHFYMNVETYTSDGSPFATTGKQKIKLLSFTEYTLQGFSQERPTLFCQAINKVKKVINKKLKK